MKRKWSVLVIAILIVSLAGCGKQQAEDGNSVTKFKAKLTLCSLREREDVRDLVDAFNAFSAGQSGVYVEYEYEIPASNPGMDEDAVRRLNARIASGEGPDLLLLDGLDGEALLEEELLADVTGVLDEGQHYVNIARPFTREGKIYAVPLAFNLMALHAVPGATESMDTLDELAAYLEAYHEEHPDRLTLDRWETPNYMEVIFQVYFPDLLEDGELEEEELAGFFRNMEKIHHASGQNWTVEESESDNDNIILDYLMLSTNWGQEGLLATGDLDHAISGVMSCIDVERLYNYGEVRDGLEFDYFRRDGEPVFVPRCVLAAAKGSRHVEEAEAFLKYSVSYKGMREAGGGINGFWINRQALQQPFSVGLDDVEEMENSRGEKIQLPLKDLTTEGKRQFFDMVESLKEYSSIDQTVEMIVMEQAETYINGEGTLEECAARAQEKIRLHRQGEQEG